MLSPGRPVLIGQWSISLPLLYRLIKCVAVLATTISDEPIVNDWVSVCVPYMPGAPSTPSRCPVKLTLVCAGQ